MTFSIQPNKHPWSHSMKIRFFSLIFIMTSVVGCSGNQMKSTQSAQAPLPSLNDSVANVDMSEFGYRGY